MDLGRTSSPHVVAHLRVEADFEALARLFSDGLAHLSSEGHVTAWTPGAEAVTSIEAGKAIGHSLDELFSRVEPPLGFAVVPEAITLYTKDENRKAIHAAALSVASGWLLSFGQQRTFSAIEQLKGEIVAAVSHELKTPIASIKAFATTMRENPEGTAEQRDEFLETIEEQADRLAHAVDDLLLAARVDAEHLIRSRELVSVDHLLERVKARLGSIATSRVECHGAEGLIACDPELLSDALAHVIDNALKFSSEGSAVLVEGECDEHASVLRVKDRGIGISADHHEYIFERFYRVDRNLSAPTGGSGLGLFVARAILQAHGGSILVSSSPGEGSTFTLTIPVRA